MAYNNQINEQDADGSLARTYDAVMQRSGSVAHILKIMSLDAGVLQASMQFYIRLMKSPNALDGARREMLATVVCNVNACYY